MILARITDGINRKVIGKKAATSNGLLFLYMKGISNYKLRVYKEVAELLSFTDASISLGISQASVSKIVCDLEEEFSDTLIERSTTRVELTSAGRTVLQYASEALALEERAKYELTLLEEKFEGKIVIGVENRELYTYIDALIGRFCNLFPHIEFRVVIDNSENMLKEVDRGEIDVVFLKNTEPSDTLYYIIETKKNERATYIDSFVKYIRSAY